jgi:flagellar basal body-associated protein FliL
MPKSTYRKKRNKLTVILLSPILIIVFIVGWSLYFFGQSRQSKAKQPQKSINRTLAQEDEVELIAIPHEEKQIPAK